MNRGPLKAQTLGLLRARGVPVSTVLDVGVQYGTPELIAAYPDVPHVLFEPVEEFAAGIHASYAGVEHELVSAAVSDESGSVSLKTFTVLEGHAISHSIMTDEPQGEVARTVPKVSLDDYLSRHPHAAPYLLKIDVDGAELRILRGARDTLSNCSIVLIEAPKSQFIERIAAVAAAGFELFDLTEPCYYDGAFWQCDAVLVRRDLMREHFRRLSNQDFDAGLYEIFTG